jgi:hypothetical protein
MAAQRNVLAHLLKLEHEGRVVQFGDPGWPEWLAEPEDDDLPPEDETSVTSRQFQVMQRDGMRRFAPVAR